MVQVPWPYTNAPGAESQEGAGRLINVYVERRGDDQAIVWRRVPGTVVFVVDPSAGSLDGSATLFAVSSVVNAKATLRGTSLISSDSRTVATRSASGAINAEGAVVGASAVQIAADGTLGGDAELDAIGTS